MCEKYNGWANYETWAVALWIDNDQSSYNYWRDVSKVALQGSGGDKREAKLKIAEELRDFIMDEAPEVSGMYGDLLTSSLQAVDVYESAENWLEDIEYEPEE